MIFNFDYTMILYETSKCLETNFLKLPLILEWQKFIQQVEFRFLHFFIMQPLSSCKQITENCWQVAETLSLIV